MKFKEAYNKMSVKQKTFVKNYIKSGFNSDKAAVLAGYSSGGRGLTACKHTIDLYIKENDITSQISEKWILSEYKKLYNDKGTPIHVKVKILENLSRILQIQHESNVTINNNNYAPVQINFTQD